MPLDKYAYGYMSKYRLLTEEELEEFHEEFIKYLVVNGITSEDWEKLKTEEPETASKIMNLFSDVILEGVLRQIKFMDFRTKSYLQAVQCLDNKLVMFALSTEDEQLDLRAEIDLSAQMESLHLHSSEREYGSSREEDLFAMTTKGFQISDGSLFKLLAMAKADTKE